MFRSALVSVPGEMHDPFHQQSELQGTGPFMAYEVGARLKNPEFHYINIRPVKHEIEGSGILPAMGGRWINSTGEYYMESYDPVLKDRANVYKIIQAAAKEAMKGHAPISMDVHHLTEANREKFRLLMVSHGWQRLLFEKCLSEEGYDILKDNIEWQPAYESNKLGIDTDLEGRSSVEGLFAAGMARVLGINPFTGWSIASCTWSGDAAGRSAGDYARSADEKEVDLSDAVKKRDEFMRPLKLSSGTNPDKLIREIQEVLFPYDVLIIMHEQRLNKALERILEIKETRLPTLEVSEARGLIKSKEARTMVLSAEMTLRASLLRRETRENLFFREDRPEPDNENWLKWIVVKKEENGEMSYTTEGIPFERYSLKPDR